MKNLKDFILENYEISKISLLEGRTIDSIKIRCEQTNEEIEPTLYAYDKESFDKLIDKIKHNDEYWKDKHIFLAELKNKSTWVCHTNEEFRVKVYNIDNDFFNSDEHTYSYDDILNMIESNNIMVIVVKE